MAQFQFRRDARLSMSARLPDMGINGRNRLDAGRTRADKGVSSDVGERLAEPQEDSERIFR
jgi:hypothetical protein